MFLRTDSYTTYVWGPGISSLTMRSVINSFIVCFRTMWLPEHLTTILDSHAIERYLITPTPQFRTIMATGSPPNRRTIEERQTSSSLSLSSLSLKIAIEISVETQKNL
jgi:hypothetical protein